MVVNEIAVRRVTIRALGEWNALRRTQKPQTQSWPRTSDTLCWYCCHSFGHTPAFLPVHCDLDKDVFVFAGNFCSWNCVKKYAFDLQKQNRAPKGVVYIGILSFMTCQRGTACVKELHAQGMCRCVETFQPIKLPPPKEALGSFGGYMSIDQFREGFFSITNYEWIELFFHRCHDFLQTIQQARRLPDGMRRAWGFEYVSYPAPPGTTVEYVHILPLSNRVLRQTDLGTQQPLPPQPSKPRRAVSKKDKDKDQDRPFPSSPIALETTTTTAPTSPSASSVQSSIQGTRRPRPSRAKAHVPHPTPAPQQTTKPAPPIMTNEQLLSVNEEQAYYTRNLRQFGNLVDAMGISITKPPPRA